MMKLMSLKQYMKMSKPALIRKITKTLRVMPKKRLAVLCYNITKSKLPRLRKTRRKVLPMKGKYSTFLPQTVEGQAFEARTYSRTQPYFEVKKKRKFSKKQLAAQRLFAKRARAGTLKRGTFEQGVFGARAGTLKRRRR